MRTLREPSSLGFEVVQESHSPDGRDGLSADGGATLLPRQMTRQEAKALHTDVEAWLEESFAFEDILYVLDQYEHKVSF